MLSKLLKKIYRFIFFEVFKVSVSDPGSEDPYPLARSEHCWAVLSQK